jgi:hypothetical protein
MEGISLLNDLLSILGLSAAMIYICQRFKTPATLDHCPSWRRDPVYHRRAAYAAGDGTSVG